MPNYIIYYATTLDEINECCYSILKYLDVYNLKPPTSHQVIVYTHKPALLEAYGSLCQGFELKEVPEREYDTADKVDTIKKFAEVHEGNVLYLGSATYPVKDLSMMFSNMEKGTVYGSHYPDKKSEGTLKKENITVLGFNTNTRQTIDDLRHSEDLKSVKGFIEEYIDLKEFRLLLKDFFTVNQEESIPNLIKIIHPVDAKEIQDQKKQFLQLPFYSRVLRKMRGRGWNISQYAVKA